MAYHAGVAHSSAAHTNSKQRRVRQSSSLGRVRALKGGLFTFESESCPALDSSFDPCPGGTFYWHAFNSSRSATATHTIYVHSM